MAFSDDVVAQVESWRSHSVILNTVAWKIADALGDIPEGAETHEGDVLEDLDRLIKAFKDCQKNVAIKWADGYD